MNRKRIDITLSFKTIELLNEIAQGSRSKFIETAVIDYIKRVKKKNIEIRLKNGYIEAANETLDIAKEWEYAENETLGKII